MLYYDENGETVEGVMSPEEAKGLQEKVSKLEEAETELQKLRDKDLNFKKLRDSSKEEKAKMREEMSAKERMLLDEIEDMRSDMTQKDEATLGARYTSELAKAAGDDEAVREKMERHYKRLGTPITPEQIEVQMEEAKMLTEREMAPTDSVNTYIPTSTGPRRPSEKRTDFADTSEGQALAKQIGITLEDPNKEVKPETTVVKSSEGK